MPERSIEALEAGNAFRDTLLDRADAFSGSAPMWHGWALMDAFFAGIDYATPEAMAGAQEPVAWRVKDFETGWDQWLYFTDRLTAEDTSKATGWGPAEPLYAASPAPEGWKLVPIEPTEEMLAATPWEPAWTLKPWPERYADGWRAMLAASPPSPTPPRSEQQPLAWTYELARDRKPALLPTSQFMQDVLAALKPFADYISNNAARALPDDVPLTSGSSMARRQVSAGEFRAAAAAYHHLNALLPAPVAAQPPESKQEVEPPDVEAEPFASPSPSVLDELVEMTARALFRAICTKLEWPSHPYLHERYRDYACAILSAIRHKIEAARDERAARIVEEFPTNIYGDTSPPRDFRIAAAIRSSQTEA